MSNPVSTNNQSDDTQQYLPPGQQSIYMRTAGPRKYKISSKIFIGLGLTQIGIGLTCFTLQVVSTLLLSRPTFDILGFSCPWIYILAGTIGFVSGFKKAQCPIVSFMTVCIIAAVLAQLHILSSGINATFLFPSVDSSFDQSVVFTVCFGTAVCQGILAFVECVIAIICASLCCKPVCCGQPTENLTAYMRKDSEEIEIPLMAIPNQSPRTGGVSYLLQTQLPASLASTKPEDTGLKSVATKESEKSPIN